MYTAAELFNLATKADAKEVFLSNVTLSIPDDLPDAPFLMPKKIGYLKSGKLPT